MNSSKLPWNQVAIMRPSGCQTVRKRSHSRASRQSAQFSTSSRMLRLSSSMLIACRHDLIAKKWMCWLRTGAPFAKKVLDIPALDFFAQRFHRIGHIAQVGIDRERRLVGFQRVLIVADVLEDQAEPGERAEV